MEKTIFESPLGHSYIKAVLQNGLKIFIMEKPQHNSAYALFGTQYGSIDTCFSKNGGEEVKVPEGIAHFLEHKLFESEDGDAFTRFAKTGAYANAFTSFDRTCYLFSCSQNFNDNLDILLDFVQSPYFTEKTVQKEQGIIGQEIRMYDDSPGWRVMFNMLSQMYKKHPVSIDIAGTVDSIAKIDAGLLYECYNTFYNPANMFVCVVGNVDSSEVLKKIEASIKESEPVSITRGEFEDNDEVINHYTEQALDVAIPMFCLGFKQKTAPNTELSLKQKIALSILLELICGDASELFAELTREGLINDDFDFELFSGHGYCSVIFEGESNNPKLVAEKICNQIEALRQKEIDKKMFSAAKCSLYGEAIRRFDSVEGVAMQFCECAINDYNIFDELKILKSITPEDIKRALDSFDSKNYVLSVVNPRN